MILQPPEQISALSASQTRYAGAISDLAQYSNTLSLRAAGFEDEDDDEDENEAPSQREG
jgi:hypothetical protein